jgi:hypothetical protein
VRGAGLLEIKYLFYINIYLLRNFYTPNYFYFIYYNYYFAGGLWVDCRFRYTVFVLCKCILIGKLLYNQPLFVFVFLFCFVLGFFSWGGVGGLDITYLLYINVYSLRNCYTPNYY